LINTDILNKIPGEQRTYHRYDKIICDNDNDINKYPVEFLNSLTISGLPPHKIVLKVNCIVLLIRNLKTKKALVIGTRMRIKFMHHNAIDCEVLTGTARNKRILVPSMNLTYSGTILPFNLERTQFPIIPAFVMTINKCQG
jgi:PIF1 helicase.